VAWAALFAIRTGIRRYRLEVMGRFDPTTPAESVAGQNTMGRARAWGSGNPRPTPGGAPRP